MLQSPYCYGLTVLSAFFSYVTKKKESGCLPLRKEASKEDRCRQQRLALLRMLAMGRHFPGNSDGEESARNAGDPGSIPGLGRSLGDGNGNPLQFLP